MSDAGEAALRYRPKLLTVLAEGYGLDRARRDLVAGLTVAVVALPLSMAIAVASGVSPVRGLYAAIVGGAVVSLLGGSRHQIGGPAGAFIVLVSATVARFGVEGLLTATLLAGVFLATLGALRLGSLIRHVPHAVTVGFTGAIAVTIAASQLHDFGGVHLAGAEPGPLPAKLAALAAALPTASPAALLLGLATAAAIVVGRRVSPRFPGMLVALVTATLAARLLHLPVETIGSRFGEIPHGLPLPRAPALSPALVAKVLPAALSFTLLGGIESLLSAKVADGLTGRRHRSNMELIAQGLANIASALFGGLVVTGAIARTATNIRAGAATPVSGLVHSAVLLAALSAAAPLARFIPLSALAAILLVVAWTMVEKAEVARLIRDRRGAPVLLATFAVTVAKDLTFGIAAGCLTAAALALFGQRVEEEGR